jgi:glycosyltransferase involved in cell wall biosynthesis
MTSTEKISIVVPVYNSKDCMEPLARKIDECLRDRDYELILVNDGSVDQSWEEIRRVASQSRKIMGVNLRKNSGQDNAIMAGLRQATGRYIIIMDDDLQHDPADIPNLVSECAKGYDVCFANFESKKQKWWKNLGSWLNGKAAEIVIDKPKQIYLSPFKAIRREVIDEIVKYEGPYPYVDGLLFTVTRNVTQAPAEHHHRFAGRSNYSFIRSLTVWLKLATGFSVFPLRIVTFLGIGASVIGFLLIVYFFLEYFYVGKNPEGWMSLMVVTLILGGMVMISLGTIGEYVGRTYLLLNKKPQSSAKEILKPKD